MKVRIILFFLVFNSINAQETFLNVSIKNKESLGNINNAHVIDNKENNALFVFLEEAKTTYGYEYNQNKELELELVSKGLKRKFKTIIGSAIDGHKVRLIETNKKQTKYASILFDFKNNITEELTYNFKLSPYDYYLQSYSYKNTCYMYTYNSQSNKLCKWTFLIDGSIKQKFYSLEGNYSWVNPSSKNHFHKEFQKVNNRLPNNLSITSKPYKMYEYDDSFKWTLDDNSGYTLIIDFKAPEFSPEFSRISNPKIEANSPKTNSYIFENKIAQVVSNSSQLAFVIKNLSDEKIIKSISVSKKDTIDFKNGPILQEGSAYSFGSTRKIEKTSKFLRKMSSDKNGISIYPMDDKYRVTIGGIRPQSSGGGMMMPGFGGMPIGQFGAFTMSYNPTAFAYGAYGYNGSTRIECLFDSDFSHLQGEIPENVFDKIDAYKNNLIENSESVFSIGNQILYGNYYPSKKQYVLISFK
ncbi:hypothetical protein [Winogradskyella sp. R77965]|uniref:hypothetical protein n=1 Tax=Winogradskyella sp. R77965 TaxID=3093872 RepID=UPI0037DDDFEA